MTDRQTQAGRWAGHLLRARTLCGKIGFSKSKNPAGMCIDRSASQTPFETLIVDTGGRRPNTLRKNAIVTLY